MGRPSGADSRFLTPLVGAPKRSRFGTWDLESKDGNTQKAGFTRVFLAGFYDGENYFPFFDLPTDGSDASGDSEALARAKKRARQQRLSTVRSPEPESAGWKTRAYEPGGAVDRMLRMLLTEKYRGWTFYAHNAGSFDFLHLLPALVRLKREWGLEIGLVPVGSSGLLAIDVWKTKNKWQKWRFVDSVRLLPMSLAEAAGAFGSGQKSHHQDGSQVLDRHGEPFTIDCPEDDPGWPSYNAIDCRLLYDVLVRCHDLVEVEFGGEIGLTAPSTAMKTIRRSYLHEAIPREVHTHDFVRPSYVGGRCEVFEEGGRFLSYYDINSSYVHQMTFPLPAGEAREWSTGEPPEAYKRDRIGFCEVVVDVPDDIAIPPLPIKAEPRHFPEGSGVTGKLVFPTGRLHGTWEYGELENAIACGCRIVEWKKSVWFEQKPILREFVETLYKYRNQAKCFTCAGKLGDNFWCGRCDKPGYDGGLDAFAKLLGNSGYGKFGQNPKRIKFYWVTDPEMPEGCTPLIEEDPDCQVWIREEEADAAFIMPQISARITALARVHLHKFAMKAMHRVLRECMNCHSKVTFAHRASSSEGLAGTGVRGPGSGEDRNLNPTGTRHPATGSLFPDRKKPIRLEDLVLDCGGTGDHGDLCQGDRIGSRSVSCPCGGALETRFGRVYYMDTDAIKTDVQMPTGSELGEWKDEFPRFSGFVHGRFYGPKLYRLSVEPDYLRVSEHLRRVMMGRDKKFLQKLRSDAEEKGVVFEDHVRVALGGRRTLGKPPGSDEPWDIIKAKGMGKKSRTKENLETLYQGALERLAWIADPNNHHPDGRVREMPKELKTAGTVMEKRLEKLGTLARLVRKNEHGETVLRRLDNGQLVRQSAAFERGPVLRNVPKRLHLEGAKRVHLGDGTTRPYQIDMTKKQGSRS